MDQIGHAMAAAAVMSAYPFAVGFATGIIAGILLVNLQRKLKK